MHACSGGGGCVFEAFPKTAALPPLSRQTALTSQLSTLKILKPKLRPEAARGWQRMSTPLSEAGFCRALYFPSLTVALTRASFFVKNCWKRQRDNKTPINFRRAMRAPQKDSAATPDAVGVWIDNSQTRRTPQKHQRPSSISGVANYQPCEMLNMTATLGTVVVMIPIGRESEAYVHDHGNDIGATTVHSTLNSRPGLQ